MLTGENRPAQGGVRSTVGHFGGREVLILGNVEIFNALEAAWWFVLAGLAANFGRYARGVTPGRQGALVAFLALFGVSDAIEVFTGAWWNPPALLMLKAICLSGLTATAGLIYGERWRKRKTGVVSDSKMHP